MDSQAYYRTKHAKDNSKADTEMHVCAKNNPKTGTMPLIKGVQTPGAGLGKISDFTVMPVVTGNLMPLLVISEHLYWLDRSISLLA